MYITGYFHTRISCIGSCIHRCPATLWSPCHHSPLGMKARGQRLRCSFSLSCHWCLVLSTFTGNLPLSFCVPPERLVRTLLAFLVPTANSVCSVACSIQGLAWSPLPLIVYSIKELVANKLDFDGRISVEWSWESALTRTPPLSLWPGYSYVEPHC